MRGRFAITNEQYEALLINAPSYGVHEVFVVSTCNRTEIYGIANHPTQLKQLLCSQTKGSLAEFEQSAYIKRGHEAICHLFEVGSGLDSQILGDYEIVGQIKQAAKVAKAKKRLHAFTERLVNSMLQSSKAIKNNSSLSDGTVSVSFAAVQFMRAQITSIHSKKIVLVGTGKFGRTTCKNLVDYLGTKNITVINRTEEKAIALANEMGLHSAPMKELHNKLAEADIILAATDAAEPVIYANQLGGTQQKLVFDLSIPASVESTVAALPNVTLINVDQLSTLKDETLARRVAEVPKAKVIIAAHVSDFLDWHQMRQHVPLLKEVKTKLKEIHTSPLYITLQGHQKAGSNADKTIQQVINCMASKIKEQNLRGCYYIEAIHEFIAAGTD